MLHFPERLKQFRDLHGLNNAKLGRMLGINGQSVGQIIRKEKGYSKPLEVLLGHLEREANRDPFLTACQTILERGDDSILHGFTMNIFSVMTNVDPEEADRLRNMQQSYLAKRKRDRKARDVG